MRRPHRAMSMALFVAAIFGSTFAYCDTSKTFSFENQDKFNVGPLRMYVESSHCIADPAALLSEFGTPEAPRVLGAKEKATALVSPASGDIECAGEGIARFTMRFFEDASAGAGVTGNTQRISSVTFALGKNDILDIDNQGPGGFSIGDVGSKKTRATAPSYSIDWQRLQATRRDVVYSKNGKLEATIQCMNQTRKACKGTLRVSSRWDSEEAGANGASAILAKGAYNIPHGTVKTVTLNTTKAGRRLFTREHILAFSGSNHDVSLNAKPGGSGPILSLATANIPTLPAAVQGAQLNLNVINNSFSMTSACLFQQSQQVGIYPVAWFAKRLAPNTSVRFAWSNNDYAFVWSETGQLVPGVTFSPSQIIPAAIGSKATLSVTNGAAQFDSPTPFPSQPNSLTVNSAPNVNPGRYAVGVGLSGSPIYVAQAQPNMTALFSPPSNKVWLFAGNCETGEVLDEFVPNAVEIAYAGQTQATAILQPDGTWMVRMGGGL